MSRVLLIVVLVLAIAGSVAAGPNDNWIIYLKAADSQGVNNLAGSCIYGTKLGATDLPAEMTNDTSNAAGTAGTAAVLGAFDLGPGSYDNGYYKDLRAPYDPANHPLPVWNLRLYVQQNWSAGDLYLAAWNPMGSYALNGAFQIGLRVVNDPTGTYAPGTVLWRFGNGVYGTSANPQMSAVFHNTDAIKGCGYVSLQLFDCSQVAAVPEPSCFASLAAVLSGFSGLAILRRRCHR